MSNKTKHLTHEQLIWGDDLWLWNTTERNTVKNGAAKGRAITGLKHLKPER